MRSEVALSGFLAAKSRVYNALITRYIIAKYGRGDLGFVWVIIEPMLLCVGVMVVWSILKGGKEHGLSLVSIVFTGYMPLTLWRHMSNSTGYLLRSSKPLVQFRNISFMDVLLSRLMLEFISVTASAIIVYLALYIFNLLPPIYDFALVTQGWLIMAGLGFGGGLLIAAASEASDLTEKFIPPFQYLMLPFSGCFFMLAWLPDASREAIAWVPFVHSFETLRAGFFGPEITTYQDQYYALFWIVIFSACGFALVNKVENNIEP